jgi:hypothetical protein
MRMTTTREDELIDILESIVKELIEECGYETAHIVNLLQSIVENIGE